MDVRPGDKLFVDHDRHDQSVILNDPVVWRARPGGDGKPPEQADISKDVAEVTVSAQTITITGKDGSRAKASHAPESQPGMRSGIIESIHSG